MKLLPLPYVGSILLVSMLSACGTESESPAVDTADNATTVTQPVESDTVSDVVQDDTSTAAKALASMIVMDSSATETAESAESTDASGSAEHNHFDEIWISLLEAELVSATGTATSLFSNVDGEAINVLARNDVGQLLAIELIEPAQYTQLVLTTAPEVTLVSADGTSATELFDAPTGEAIFALDIDLTVESEQPITLLVDFSARHFTVDETTGFVTPKIRVKTNGEHRQLDGVKSHAHGQVTEILSADSFVIAHHRNAETLITVTLAENATVTDVSTDITATDTSTLTTDVAVLVNGNFDPESQTITAEAVFINPQPRDEDHAMRGDDRRGERRSHDTDGLNRIHGTVVSFDGSTLVVDVVKSNIMPSTESLTIAGASNAEVIHGDLTALATGQEIDVIGEWDGINFTASVIKIEGYDGGDKPTSRLMGTVVSADESVIVLNNVILDEVALNEEDAISLVVDNAFFDVGYLECIVPDIQIAAAGEFDESTTTFTSGKIRVLGGECDLEQNHHDGHGDRRERNDADHDREVRDGGHDHGDARGDGEPLPEEDDTEATPETELDN